MDRYTRQAIVQNHIEPLMAAFGLDKRKNEILESPTRVKVEAVWNVDTQEKFIYDLAQSLGSKGYELDVWREGKKVIIDDKDVEE